MRSLIFSAVGVGVRSSAFSAVRPSSLQGRNLPPCSIFNQYYWSKKTTSNQSPTRRKDKCSSPIRMVDEDEVEAEEVDSTYPTKGVHNFRDTEVIEEPSQEGGASTPNKVGKACHLPATIAAKLAIAKRSVEKEEVSRMVVYVPVFNV